MFLDAFVKLRDYAVNGLWGELSGMGQIGYPLGKQPSGFLGIDLVPRIAVIDGIVGLVDMNVKLHQEGETE